MKYKVILQSTENSASGNYPGLAAITFYTLSQATNAATTWRDFDANHIAWLWDGTIWREYKN